ncbi:unnamed protein product [Thelazia callipaeda]|uniref:BRO1 domain-containing protein n=1 Tax=Thelazia callipaeda TaxID=103827 RepID=A0A0N5D9P3_THECL|nr:unnamed protein product [Thelazia callipaeda]
MEGMPRVPMLTSDVKVCSPSLPASFSAQIKNYILTHYQDDPEKYNSAISELENMRSKLRRILPDTETITILKRYYAQLCLMKNRFPMEKGDAIRIPFSWMDKNVDMTNATSFEDINYELACVMYDIGAVHGAIAVNESRADVDSIKTAFMHFQCAAYPFQFIRDSMSASKFSVVDFDPIFLTFYINIFLAQAQECLLEKSILDHRKNTVIAKLAFHLKELYLRCREHLGTPGSNDIFSAKYKEYMRTCDVKAEIYGAIAMLHLGFQSESENKMGYRVAYFDLALEHVTSAMKLVEKDKRENLKEAVVFLNDVILGKHTNAKKENEFIYHDRVPKSEELTTVEGVNMVKIVGFDPTDPSIADPDLFAALLPGHVLKSVSVYSEEKAKFKRAILEKVEQKDKELESFIKSLHLEEINFDGKSEIEEMPEMLLERSAAFKSQPDAFPELLDKLHKVGDCAIEADHKISNLRNRLDAISSVKLKTDEGFVAIMKELNRINDHHVKARTNNAELQRALAAHSGSLKILAMPLNELSKRLTDTHTKPGDTTEGQLLKKILDKADEMSVQRRNLLLKLNDDLLNDDITAKCLVEKNEDNSELYEKELKKHESTASLIDLNLAAQTNILNALTDANANFGDYRKKIIEENRSRMDQVLTLVAAYDLFIDVLQKTEEGLQFYSTLFSLIKSLDGAVGAVESAFEDEKKEAEKEMMRELEKHSTSITKWTPSLSTKNEKFDVLVSSENARRDSVAELAGEGLRLKDYLEYYRNNIAMGRRSYPTNASSVPNNIQVATNRARTPYIPSPMTNFHSSNPLQSNVTTLSDHPGSSALLNTVTSGIRHLSTLPGEIIPLPNHLGHSTSSISYSHSQATDASLSQHLPPLPSHLPNEQINLGFQNSTATPFTFTSASAQHFSPTSVIPDSSRAAAKIGLFERQATPLLRNISSSSIVKQPMSCASSYIPVNSAHVSISSTPPQSGASIKYNASIEAQKSSYGVRQPPLIASQLSPINRDSNLTRNIQATVSTTSISGLGITFPPRRLIYSQGGKSQMASPWHQPLQNMSNATMQPIITKTDLMNAPLTEALPAPLIPTYIQACEQEKLSSPFVITTNLEVPESTVKQTEVTNSEQLSESPQGVHSIAGSYSCSQTNIQTLRPAAAVAPIMQTDCTIASTNDSMLCFTNVTSMSYTAPATQLDTMVAETPLNVNKDANVNVEGIKNIAMVNHHTFTLGEADPIRMEKRHRREQFKTEGVNLQSPPLDPSDPINCIDAHFWLNKP